MSEEKRKKSGKEAEKTQEFSFCVVNSCLLGIWHLSKPDPTYKIFIFKTGFQGLASIPLSFFFPHIKPPRTFSCIVNLD